MNHVNLSFEQINLLNRTQLSIASNQEELSDFINNSYTQENFLKQIELKKESFSEQNRKLIAKYFKDLYSEIECTVELKDNISNLSNPNSFTITTGHQLTLFGGPAFFFNKIIHIISLCESLNKSYPKYHFIPVFWMASEDHDFDEIKEVNIYNNSFKWQSNQKGAVGRFQLESIDEIKSKFIDLFSNGSSDDVISFINAYQGNNLSEALFNFLHSIFASKGLLIIDADDKKLKKAFSPIMKEEIQNGVIYNCVNKTNIQLLNKDFKVQAHAREVNLFYLTNNSRQRIIKKLDSYEIGEDVFSKDELLNLLESEPHNFSPNVLFRPIYQESILPNLCYVGGGGEMSYWLQLKSSFDQFKIPYPIISQRKIVFYLNRNIQKKIKKINLPIASFFKEFSLVKKEYLKSINQEVNYIDVDQKLNVFSNSILELSKDIDSQGKFSIGVDLEKINKLNKQIKKRIEKSVAIKNEQNIELISKVKSYLFPSNIPQERFCHFFQFSNQGKLDILSYLFEEFEPFNHSVLIVYE